MNKDELRGMANATAHRTDETLAAIMAGILIASKVDWSKTPAATHGPIVLELAREVLERVDEWWPKTSKIPPPGLGSQFIVPGGQ